MNCLVVRAASVVVSASGDSKARKPGKTYGGNASKASKSSKPFSKLLKSRTNMESRRVKQLMNIAKTLDDVVRDEMQAIEQFKKSSVADDKKTGAIIDVDFKDDGESDPSDWED